MATGGATKYIHHAVQTFAITAEPNERAGFMNNWKRMNLEEVGRRAGATEQVFTVVNNRADRVPRSMVFADILVRDIAVDRHVLIGTNLSGLRIYLGESMDRYLANIRVAEAGDPLSDARRRLETFLDRVRLRDAPAASLLAQLETMARASGRDFRVAPTGEAALDAALDDLASSFQGWDSGYEAARKHAAVRALIEAIRAAATADATALAPAAEAEPTAALVSFAHGDVADVDTFFAERVTCVVAARHFRSRLAETLGEGTAPSSVEPQLDALHADLVRTWRERFWYTVVSLDDSDISGDAIIVRAAKSAPPGFDVALMGTQNIKGTGLDFVYRWVELHGVRRRVDALADAPEALFGAELLWLSSSTGFHLTDALTAWRELRDIQTKRKCSPRELALITRASSHLGQLALRRIADASATTSAPVAGSPKTRVLAAIERFLDPLDAVWRRYRSDRLMRLLAARRISHLRMAAEMRDLMKRQKGGWLSKR